MQKLRFNKIDQFVFSFILSILFIFPPGQIEAQNSVQQNQLKFGRLLRLVDGYYVDSTNVDALTEKAIVNLLTELDPHSTYISKEEVDKMNEPLKGNFEGIGISFNIYKDTLMVTTTISGGPSEKVGLRAGDRIVSGAVQDWDRGVIIGRRSFGKGLVQKPFFLTDGSMVRLTTAHYYTPSGRCIQKPYEKGVKEYRKDFANRMNSGEMFSADSIEFDQSLKHKTLLNGRDVFGGGGVMPDIFIPMDTSIHYRYVNRLRRNSIINNYVLDYVDTNREDLKNTYPEFIEFNMEFKVTDKMIKEIVAKGEEEKIEKNKESLEFAMANLKKEVKAFIARDIFSRNDLFKIFNKDDEAILKALKVIENQNQYNNLLVSTK